MVRLNALTFRSLSEDEREEWLQKQRDLKPPGSPSTPDPWAGWNEITEDGSVRFLE